MRSCLCVMLDMLPRIGRTQPAALCALVCVRVCVWVVLEWTSYRTDGINSKRWCTLFSGILHGGEYYKQLFKFGNSCCGCVVLLCNEFIIIMAMFVCVVCVRLRTICFAIVSGVWFSHTLHQNKNNDMHNIIKYTGRHVDMIYCQIMVIVEVAFNIINSAYLENWFRLKSCGRFVEVGHRTRREDFSTTDYILSRLPQFIWLSSSTNVFTFANKTTYPPWDIYLERYIQDINFLQLLIVFEQQNTPYNTSYCVIGLGYYYRTTHGIVPNWMCCCNKLMWSAYHLRSDSIRSSGRSIFVEYSCQLETCYELTHKWWVSKCCGWKLWQNTCASWSMNCTSDDTHSSQCTRASHQAPIRSYISQKASLRPIWIYHSQSTGWRCARTPILDALHRAVPLPKIRHIHATEPAPAQKNKVPPDVWPQAGAPKHGLGIYGWSPLLKLQPEQTWTSYKRGYISVLHCW